MEEVKNIAITVVLRRMLYGTVTLLSIVSIVALLIYVPWIFGGISILVILYFVGHVLDIIIETNRRNAKSV